MEYYIDNKQFTTIGIWKLKKGIILDHNKYIIIVNATSIDICLERDRKFEHSKLQEQENILLNNKKCKKILYICDCHEYSYKDGYIGLLNKIKTLHITNLAVLTGYSLEYYYLKSILYPYCDIITIPWISTPNFNNTIFKKYDVIKKYDILLYGTVNTIAYRFRFRIKKLLETDKFKTNFNIRIINPEEGIRKVELAKLISMSYLTFTCKSNYNYMLQKHFEIPLSNSMVIGDMPSYGKLFYNNNDYIEINNEMTDEKIFDIINETLKNKAKILDITEKVRNRMVSLQRYDGFGTQYYALKDIDINTKYTMINDLKFSFRTIIVNNIDENPNIECSKQTKINKLKLLLSYNTIIYNSGHSQTISSTLTKLPRNDIINKNIYNTSSLFPYLNCYSINELISILNKHNINCIMINTDNIDSFLTNTYKTEQV